MAPWISSLHLQKKLAVPCRGCRQLRACAVRPDSYKHCPACMRARALHRHWVEAELVAEVQAMQVRRGPTAYPLQVVKMDQTGEAAKKRAERLVAGPVLDKAWCVEFSQHRLLAGILDDARVSPCTRRLPAGGHPRPPPTSLRPSPPSSRYPLLLVRPLLEPCALRILPRLHSLSPVVESR